MRETGGKPAGCLQLGLQVDVGQVRDPQAS
jgi:hypothetical protein